MKDCTGLKRWNGGAGIWSPDDLRSLTDRIDKAKELSGCSIARIMEFMEILEQIEEMRSDFPLHQQQYFTEAVDELISLAISYLEHMRAEENWG